MSVCGDFEDLRVEGITDSDVLVGFYLLFDEVVGMMIIRGYEGDLGLVFPH